MDQTIERRQTARIEPLKERRLDVNVALGIQVLDISQSGVLISSKNKLAVGDRAQLKASADSRSVSVTIEIRHVSVHPESARGIRYRAGAAFVALSPDQRLVLDQLLRGEQA
jgi:hypothetical protein